jgi:hypothetical protein
VVGSCDLCNEHSCLIKAGNLSSGWATICFSWRTLLHGVSYFNLYQSPYLFGILNTNVSSLTLVHQYSLFLRWCIFLHSDHFRFHLYILTVYGSGALLATSCCPVAIDTMFSVSVFHELLSCTLAQSPMQQAPRATSRGWWTAGAWSRPHTSI